MSKTLKWISNLKDWQVLVIGLILIIIGITTSPFKAGVFMTLEEYVEYTKLSKIEQHLNYMIRIIKGIALLMSALIGGGFIGEWCHRKIN